MYKKKKKKKKKKKRGDKKKPTQPIANPKGQYMVDGSDSGSTTHEQVQAVTTLRSGRTVDNHVSQKDTEEDESQPNSKLPLENPKEKLKTILETLYEPRAPFPERLKESPSAGKQGERYQEMMDVFKKVQINIPFLDAIR